MNKKKLFVGDIKKCLDAYSLEHFGEERYVGRKKANAYTVGNHEVYVKLQKSNAVLLKGRHDKYIDVEDIKGLKDLLLFKLGKSHKIMKIKPKENNELYVDEKSIKPYIEEEHSKIKIKH